MQSLTVTCRQCGCEFSPHGCIEVDGNHYCESCHEDLFSCCECCGETCYREDMSDCLCESCYEDTYTSCNHCGTQIARENSVSNENGCDYCEDCYIEIYTSCNDCGCEIQRCDAIIFMRGYEYYCSSCAPNDDDDDCEWTARRMPHFNGEYDKVGSARQFGVELETNECNRHWEIQNDTRFGAKHDGSIDGKEFVSPKLRGNQGLAEIEKLCKFATQRNWSVDRSCGFHLHFDVLEETPDNLYKIALGYKLTANLWASFVPATRRTNGYCGPIEFELSTMQGLFYRSSWERYCAGRDRYCWFNVASYPRHGTFEVRLHTGTLDSAKVCNWIKVNLRFVEWLVSNDIETIKEKLSGNLFEAMSDIWNDTELTEYYRARAAKFGQTYVDTREISLCGV